jgi:transcriptional regulator with XRE-family HTH domain
MTPQELRARRTDLSLTQKEAASRCGVTEHHYYRLERGVKTISERIRIAMATPPCGPGVARRMDVPNDAKPASNKRAAPPFKPTAGPLVDGLVGAERAIGLVRLIRDALRDSGLA